jgi:hypothetical protein
VPKNSCAVGRLGAGTGSARFGTAAEGDGETTALGADAAGVAAGGAAPAHEAPMRHARTPKKAR